MVRSPVSLIARDRVWCRHGLHCHTEETTVTQRVSHGPSEANPARGHREIRRSTGHIMVTTRYSNQQGSEIATNPCQVQPPENIGNLSASTRCLFFLPVFQNLNYNPYREDCLMCRPGAKVIKNDSKSLPSYRRITRRQVMRHFTRNGTGQCQNALCCRLPTASVLSNKADKSRSDQF